MELALLVYVLDLIPRIGTLIFTIMVITGIFCGFIVFAHYIIEEVDYTDKVFDLYKMARWVFLATFIYTVFIPSNKATLYTMVGAYTAQSVVTSDTGKRIVKVLEAKIADELDKVEKEIKK